MIYEQMILEEAQERGMNTINQIGTYRVKLKRHLRERGVVFNKSDSTMALEKLARPDFVQTLLNENTNPSA